MIIALIVIGLCLGSFVNALVWRTHEQSKPKKSASKLSITNGRSMCPHCYHQLATKDLLPVISWLSLRGKCRYCTKPISVQYPLVELTMALLFIASYSWWPATLEGAQIALFGLWLAILVGLVALFVYDLRWQLLPNRLMYPLIPLAAAYALISILIAANPLTMLINVLLAVAAGGGLFYALFQLSAGKWIGGGDVKLGWLLGLIAGTPARSLLFIFIGSLIGSLISLPLLARKRLKRTSTIPFGPFLIAGMVVTELFGKAILSWYQRVFLGL